MSYRVQTLPIAFRNPIPIMVEDAILHTDEHPFCHDPSCPCHDVVTGDAWQNEAYLRLIARPLLDGLLTAEEATLIFFDEQEVYHVF